MNPMVKMILTLVVITAGAAAALSAANHATADKIKAEAEAKAARAVLKIFPDCGQPVRSEAKSPGGEIVVVYRCPGDRVCFSYSTASDKGISRPYSGLVRAMIGVDAKGSIAGVRIIAQSETPGLGAKIADSKFLSQFQGKSAQTVWKVKKDDPAGAVDGISGATISSRTVTTLLESALKFHQDALAGPNPSQTGPTPAPPSAKPAPPSAGPEPPANTDNRRRGHRIHKFSPPSRPGFNHMRQQIKKSGDQKRGHARSVGAEKDGKPVPRTVPSENQGGE